MPELSSPAPDTGDRPTPPATSGDSLRILAFVACGLLVSVKADGRFPLPDSLSEMAFQALLLPYTLALCLAAAAFLWAEPLCARLGARAGQLLSAVGPLTWGLALAAALEVLALVILRWEARKYAAFGYSPPSLELAALGLGVVVALAWLALRRSGTGGRLLATAGLAYLGSQLVSMSHFPLNPGRSDMLPLIAAAVRRFLDGQSPYGLYELPHVVPLTYLPGTWLAFVPAVLLGLDLRWVHALCTIAAAVLLHSAAAQERRTVTGTVCALFLLTPYLQYRHEIYLGPSWLAFALVAWCEARGRRVLGAVAMGWACGSSQFAWLIVPVYLAHMWRTGGGRRARAALALLTLVTAVLVVPFAIWSPQQLAQGVLGHWEQTTNATTANLSYLLGKLVGVTGLRVIQLALWVGLTVYFVTRVTSQSALFRAAAVLVGVFVLLNSIVWVYFYLTVFLLMCACAALGGGDAARVRRE